MDFDEVVTMKISGDLMREQLLLLIRVSKQEYNKTLYDDYKVFMNSQLKFNDHGLTEGQHDKYEGRITNEPCRILYSVDQKKWNLLADEALIRKDNSAYIYCMYGLKYDEKYYDAEKKQYCYEIPWEYIESLWQGEGTEMMVIKNTSVFIEKMKKAAIERNLSWAYGKVHYDLEEKLSDMKYFELVMNDGFESVFHKVRGDYEIQKEVRFAVKCPDKPEYFELQLDKKQDILFDVFTLEYGRNILVELSDLEFDVEHKIPLRFSTNIKYYESGECVKR